MNGDIRAPRGAPHTEFRITLRDLARAGLRTGPAPEVLERIGVLYEIEEQIRGLPPDKRAAVRRVSAGLFLEDFRAWPMSSLSTSSKKSALAIRVTPVAITRSMSGQGVMAGRLHLDVRFHKATT
jgi:hypothetical protein